MKVETFKLYPDREDVTLTAYILDDSPEILKGKPRGGVVVCPGGAYLNCSDREAEPVALRFAAMGYHAFVLRYSVQDENGRDKSDLFKEGPKVKDWLTHPAPVREIGMSFKLIHDHAVEWLVDTEKLAVCGFSAGGHNAAMYAAYWNTDMVRGALGCTSAELRPAAAILGYPITDYLLMKDREAEDWERAFFATSNTAFFGEPDPSDELLDEVSPARHITKDTPASFVWATAADGLVPVQQSLAWARGCADAKVPFEVHIYERGDHGLSLANGATSGTSDQMNPDVAEWIDHAAAFLSRRFAVELPSLRSGASEANFK